MHLIDLDASVEAAVDLLSHRNAYFAILKLSGTDTRRILYLRVRRNLVPSYTATDPDWLAQIVNPAKIRFLKEQWKACDAKIKEQTTPSLVPDYSNFGSSTL